MKPRSTVIQEEMCGAWRLVCPVSHSEAVWNAPETHQNNKSINNAPSFFLFFLHRGTIIGRFHLFRNERIKPFHIRPISIFSVGVGVGWGWLHSDTQRQVHCWYWLADSSESAVVNAWTFCFQEERAVYHQWLMSTDTVLPPASVIHPVPIKARGQENSHCRQ